MASELLAQIVADQLAEARLTSNIGLRLTVDGDIDASSVTTQDILNYTLSLLSVMDGLLLRVAAEIDNLCSRVEALEGR